MALSVSSARNSPPQGDSPSLRLPEGMTAAEYYLKDFSVMKKPSLEIVSREFRKALPSEKVFHSSAIDLLLKSPMLPVETYVDLERRRGEVIAKRDEAASYLEGHVHGLQEPFYQIVEELLSSGHLPPNGFNTSSLPDLRFVDKGGRVVFESFGHLITTATRYYFYGNELYRRALSEYRGRGYDEAPFSPIEKMGHLVGVNLSIEDGRDVEEKRLIYLSNREGDPILQLSSLNGLDPDNLDASLTGELAVRAVKEAGLQLCGGIPKDFASFARFYFCSDDGTVSVRAWSIIDAAQTYLCRKSEALILYSEVAKMLAEEIGGAAGTEPRGRILPLTRLNFAENPSVLLHSRNQRVVEPHENQFFHPNIDRLNSHVLKDPYSFTDKKTYERYTREVLELFHEVIEGLIRDNLLDPSNAKTNDLSDLKFIGTGGVVLFESFGHLLSTACFYQTYLEGHVPTNHALSAHWIEHCTPIDFLTDYLALHRGIPEEQLNSQVSSMLHLEALREKPEKAWGERKVFFEGRQAVSALREACLHLTGGIIENLEELGVMDFRGDDRAYGLQGRTLIRRARKYVALSDPRKEMASLEELVAVLRGGEAVEKVLEAPKRASIKFSIPDLLPLPSEVREDLFPVTRLRIEGNPVEELTTRERRKVDKQETSFTCKEIDELVSLSPPTYQEFLQERDLGQMSQAEPTFKEFLRGRDLSGKSPTQKRNHYFREYKPVLARFLVIAKKAIKKFDVDSKNLKTSSLPHHKFVTKDGEVVFESFSELLVMAARYWNHFQTFDPFPEPLRRYRGVTPIAVLERIKSGSVKAGPFQPVTEFWRLNDAPEARFMHLESIADEETVSLSAGYVSNGLTSLKALREACLQLTGGIPENIEDVGGLITSHQSHRDAIDAERYLAWATQYIGRKMNRAGGALPHEVIAFLRVKDAIRFEGQGNDIDPTLLEAERGYHRLMEFSLGQKPSLVTIRRTDPGEKTFAHPLIEKLFTFPLHSAEHHWKLKGGRQGETVKQYEEIYAEKLLGAFHEISMAFRKWVGESSKDLYDTRPEFYDTRLVTKGHVVFESYEHLSVTVSRYYRYLLNERNKLAGNFSEEDEKNLPDVVGRLMSPYKGLDSEDNLAPLEIRLTSLNGFIRGQEVPSGATACRILREACLTCCGGIPYSLEDIKSLKFSGYDTEYFLVRGNELVEKSLEHLSTSSGETFSEEMLIKLLRERWEDLFDGREIESSNLASQNESKQKSAKLTDEEYTVQVANEFHVSPQVLFFALCSLGLEKERPQAYKDFGDRIIQFEGEEKKSSRSQKPLEVIEALIERAAPPGGTIDYNDLFRQRFTDLLKQLCYRYYDGDVSAVLEELDRCKKRADSKEDRVSADILGMLLTDITPGLQKLFEEVRDFKDPETIRKILLPEQREAIVGATLFQKPLVIFGTGCGKTEIAAAYCEHIGAKRVFWGTNPGNVSGTATRLETETIAGVEGKVGKIDREWIHKSYEEFQELLKNSRYIVAGYDTLAHIQEKAPRNFALLQEWMRDATRVLDEAQALDNHRSKRSKALQALEAAQTLITSATPFQHRPSRIATLLHLALPKEYPDPEALARELKGDRERIRALMERHSTIYSIEDMADYFEAPEICSYEDQLMSGRPRIPRLECHRVPYELSLAHGRHYVDIATNWPAYAEQQGLKLGVLHQVAALLRLTSEPERLGAPPPFALIDKVKEIALPALREGREVLIFGHRLHPLRLLAQDPELKEFGASLISGSTKPSERSAEFQRLENDPNFSLAVCQVGATATGNNCRSISEMIFIDRPPLISGTIQALGRPIRLLFEGDERFAKEKVNAWFLEASLPAEAYEEVEDPKRKKVLKNGTTYQRRLDLDLEGVEKYRYYTARGRSKSNPQQLTTVAQLVQNLSGSVSRLHAASSSPDLLSVRGFLTPGFHNNPMKNAWREQGPGLFVANELHNIGKPLSEIRVACLAGPEALEIPMYLAAGILPENIYAFEGGSDFRKNLCRQNVNKYGCRFVDKRIEVALPKLDVPFDIISIDPDGYVTESLFQMLIDLPLHQETIVLKNALASREQGVAHEVLDRSGSRRDFVDLALMKLCATSDLNGHGGVGVVETLRIAKRARQVASTLARALSKEMRIDTRRLADFFVELHLGSPHTSQFTQFSYTSPSGSPFLSTFVRLTPWNRDLRESHTGRNLRRIMDCMMEEGVKTKRRPRISEVGVERKAKGEFALAFRGKNGYSVHGAELKSLLHYFEDAVPDANRLSSLLRREVPSLKLRGNQTLTV